MHICVHVNVHLSECWFLFFWLRLMLSYFSHPIELHSLAPSSLPAQVLSSCNIFERGQLPVLKPLALDRWFFCLVLSGWEWTLLLYPSVSEKSYYFCQKFGNSWEVLSGLEASIPSSMPICYYAHTHVNRVAFSHIDLEERFSHCLIKTESFLFFSFQ